MVDRIIAQGGKLGMKNGNGPQKQVTQNALSSDQ
jgi:hypothetical protein